MIEEKKSAVESEIEVKSVDSQAETLERDVKWRAKFTAKAEEAENLKKQAEGKEKDLQNKIDNTQKQSEAMQKRVIDAELKAQAVTAGLKDLDFLKMVDTSGLKISEDGTVEGLEKAINDFKTSKPLLFGSEKRTSSSKNESLPRSETKGTVLDARKMSDEEWNANKSRFMAGDFSA